eukprot:4481277-Prymnesium_polylepis.1
MPLTKQRGKYIIKVHHDKKPTKTHVALAKLRWNAKKIKSVSIVAPTQQDYGKRYGGRYGSLLP